MRCATSFVGKRWLWVLLGASGTLGTWVRQCARQAVLHHFGSKRLCFHLKLIHPHLFCPFKLLSLSELLRKYLMPPPILINSSLSHLRQLQVVTHSMGCYIMNVYDALAFWFRTNEHTKMSSIQQSDIWIYGYMDIYMYISIKKSKI